MKLILALLYSMNLRCPHCRRGPVMKNWLEAHRACPRCGYEYLKESGDFWGGIVFSYTYAALAALAVGAVLIGFDLLTISQRVYASVLTGAAAILVLHPFTRANWIALMYVTRGHYEEYRPRPRRQRKR